MNKHCDPDALPTLALELFQPKPNVLYSLDVAAHIAGASRRSVLIYCRAGFVQSVFQPPYGIMAFTEQAIHTIRRIEQVRTTYGMDFVWLKAMFDLTEELERLRTELRILRNS